MYSINVRYKIHHELAELFSGEREEDTISEEVYRFTNDILIDLEKTIRKFSKNNNVYMFGRMKEVVRSADLEEAEQRIVREAFKVLKERVDALSKEHLQNLWVPNMEDFCFLLVAESVLAGNHYKLLENYNYVLLIMKDLVV